MATIPATHLALYRKYTPTYTAFYAPNGARVLVRNIMAWPTDIAMHTIFGDYMLLGDQ